MLFPISKPAVMKVVPQLVQPMSRQISSASILCKNCTPMLRNTQQFQRTQLLWVVMCDMMSEVSYDLLVHNGSLISVTCKQLVRKVENVATLEICIANICFVL